MVRHFGAFKFKAAISEQQREECFCMMKDMVEKIPGLLKMEHGPYNGNEGLNEEFTHGFIMTFDTPESRDAYLPHPIHEKVKEVVVQRLERVVVFDINV
jgi:hypothetical protein